MVTAWSPDIIFHNKSLFKEAIWSELEDEKTYILFYFLNIYAPFYDGRIFLETLSESGALDHEKLIVVGDINLTLTAG